jgi:N-acetylneuraminate lyase
MVTPFDSFGDVNLSAAGRLIARFIEEGAGGLYICGSTGEGPLLRSEERKQLAECVIKEVAGQVPVIVHVGHSAPVLAVELAQHAADCGADGLSSTLPPFYPYTVGQIANYWSSLALGHDLPFYGYVMHDIGCSREDIYGWLDVISRVPHLAGLKFTNADAHQLALIKSWNDGELSVLSGHDQGYLACRSQGADGAIGTTYNIALPLWMEVSRLYESGDTTAAARVMIRCSEIIGELATSYFLPKVKLVLRRQGIDCGLPRAPYCADVDIPESAINQVLAMIEQYTEEAREIRTRPVQL